MEELRTACNHLEASVDSGSEQRAELQVPGAQLENADELASIAEQSRAAAECS